MNAAPEIQKVRIDKWLWAIRFFKTRTQATDACKSGNVEIGEREAKASSLVQVKDLVKVRKNGILYSIEVLRTIEKRVGAPIAQECFLDQTPEDELLKFESWYSARSGKSEFREKGSGRPTKKERRLIDAFKELDPL